MPKKMILDIEEELWKEVLKEKIDLGLKNNNQVVVRLIQKALGKKVKK